MTYYKKDGTGYVPQFGDTIRFKWSREIVMDQPFVDSLRNKNNSLIEPYKITGLSFNSFDELFCKHEGLAEVYELERNFLGYFFKIRQTRHKIINFMQGKDETLEEFFLRVALKTGILTTTK